MTSRDLYATATGCSSILSITTEAGYSSITASAVIECDATTLELSNLVDVDFGYADDHAVVVSGYVKKIERIKPEQIYRVTVNDLLVRAVDYFIAADDPETPLQYNNIDDQPLVNALLNQAGIGPVVSAQPLPSFTFGTNPDGARFNLQSVSDAVGFICSVTGRTIYAEAGSIYYVDRKPYVVGGDTVSYTFATGAGGNIIDITEDRSNANVRNIVKVYGKSPLTAKAVGTNPYIVIDQTAVIAHELLDVQDLCNATAAVNLALMNRVQETYNITIFGDVNVLPRRICAITDSFLGLSAKQAFIYKVSHDFGVGGFTTQITAVT